MRLSRLLGFLGGGLLLGACANSHPAARYHSWAFWQPNRFDRKGLETGRWLTYYDDSKKQPFTTGHYRHGRPVRTFQYYAPTGQLDHTEIYSREGFCEVTHWHPGGQVARRGTAQWVTGGGKAPRFYWYGPWTSYDTDGQLTGVQTYIDGHLTRAETYEHGQLTRVDTYDLNRVTRTESYLNGQLIKVETFDKGQRIGTTNTL